MQHKLQADLEAEKGWVALEHTIFETLNSLRQVVSRLSEFLSTIIPFFEK